MTDRIFRIAAIAAACLWSSNGVFAQTPPLASREVPAKTIPVPNIVSPELQQIIATTAFPKCAKRSPRSPTS